MNGSKRCRWMVFVCAVGMLSMLGCSDDVLDVPVEEAVEAGLDSAITDTVVPLITFMGAIGDLLTAPVAHVAPSGQACPDTTGWCNVGSVICTPGGNGLDFDFNECQVATGDLPLLLDGDVTAVPGSTIALTLTNLFINNGSATSGTGSINTAACDYVVNVHTDDATVVGTVTQCDDDNYPTGDTVVIGFGDFQVSVQLNGTNTAPATALQGATPVAVCSINLDTFTSSCDAF